MPGAPAQSNCGVAIEPRFQKRISIKPEINTTIDFRLLVSLERAF